jgi:hypothetical protein
MTEFEQNMNHEIDIANWEDEGCPRLNAKVLEKGS